MCEFGGAEYCGDPEGFFGASLEGQVGRQVGAAVEVFLTAGQTQVQALVTEGGIFITLEDGHQRESEASLRFGDSLELRNRAMALHHHHHGIASWGFSSITGLIKTAAACW